jgi:hypothetical protein
MFRMGNAVIVARYSILNTTVAEKLEQSITLRADVDEKGKGEGNRSWWSKQETVKEGKGSETVLGCFKDHAECF